MCLPHSSYCGVAPIEIFSTGNILVLLLWSLCNSWITYEYIYIYIYIYVLFWAAYHADPLCGSPRRPTGPLVWAPCPRREPPRPRAHHWPPLSAKFNNVMSSPPLHMRSWTGVLLSKYTQKCTFREEPGFCRNHLTGDTPRPVYCLRNNVCLVINMV
jgi:hypothetical protein